MRPTIGALAVLTAMAALPAACGGRSSLDVTDASGCPMPAAFVSQSCTVSGDRCELGGVDSSGARYQLICDMASCTWKVDGQTACTCSKRDWSNVCPNNIGMCSAWSPAAADPRPPFNWGTLSCVFQ